MFRPSNNSSIDFVEVEWFAKTSLSATLAASFSASFLVGCGVREEYSVSSMVTVQLKPSLVLSQLYTGVGMCLF